MPESVVVYTSLMGDYLPLTPVPDLGIPCIAFCDREYKTGGWDMRVMDRPETHPRMKAKWFKLHPHECLPEFDVSVWIDAGIEVLDRSFPARISEHLDGAATLFFPHRERANLRDELQAHLALPKYAGIPVAEQVAHYFRQGFPDDLGLLECTVIARHHNDLRAARLNKRWWSHCLRWTFADQLSLPYVLWQMGGDERAGVRRLPFALNRQTWVKWRSWRPD